MTHYASTEKNSLPFELTDSAKLLHFTILGGSADPPAPLNDATDVHRFLESL